MLEQSRGVSGEMFNGARLARLARRLLARHSWRAYLRTRRAPSAS